MACCSLGDTATLDAHRSQTLICYLRQRTDVAYCSFEDTATLSEDRSQIPNSPTAARSLIVYSQQSADGRGPVALLKTTALHGEHGDAGRRPQPDPQLPICHHQRTWPSAVLGTLRPWSAIATSA